MKESSIPMTSRRKIQTGEHVPNPDTMKKLPTTMIVARVVRVLIGACVIVVLWQIIPTLDFRSLISDHTEAPSVSVRKGVSIPKFEHVPDTREIEDIKKNVDELKKLVVEKLSHPSTGEVKSIQDEIDTLKKYVNEKDRDLDENVLSLKIKTILNDSKVEGSTISFNDWAVPSVGTTIELLDTNIFDYEDSPNIPWMERFGKSIKRKLFGRRGDVDLLIRTPKTNVDIGDCLPLPARGGAVQLNLPLPIHIDKVILQYIPPEFRLVGNNSAPRIANVEVLESFMDVDNRSKGSSNKLLKVKEVTKSDLKWKTYHEVIPIYGLRGDTVRISVRDPLDKELQFTCLYRVLIVRVTG